MELVIFWVVASFVVGFIAQSRRRFGFGWFVLALVLSPLLMGILVLALDRPPEDQRQRLACPTCAELVIAGANKCKHCGADLAAFRAARDAAEERELERYRETDRQLRAERSEINAKVGRAIRGVFSGKDNKRNGPQDHT